MHEHALINDLMRRIARAAEAEDAERVVAVSVWLGALSHMSPEHFPEHFEHASTGTIAEGARLDIAASDDIHRFRGCGRAAEGDRGRDRTLMAVAAASPNAPAPRERVRLSVRGAVQGVGFRPFVYRQARALGSPARSSIRRRA